MNRNLYVAEIVVDGCGPPARESFASHAGPQKCRKFFAWRMEILVAGVIFVLLFSPRPAYSLTSLTDEGRIQSELAAMGKRGDLILRIREQILTVLQSENTCSAWFREADPDTAEVFRSLHYEIEGDGTSYVLHMTNFEGTNIYKHPWAARTVENGGRNSVVTLNPSGPFFNPTSPIVELDARGGRHWQGGFHRLIIGSFMGNTTRAQMITLLHELGHIVGRLPEDNDSWDGRSTRNTEAVLSHCKRYVRDVRGLAERASQVGD